MTTTQLKTIEENKKQIAIFVDTCCEMYGSKARVGLAEILQTLVETGGETADAIERLNEMHAMYAEEDE